MNILLTGSSSGIGKFLADNLAAKGHSVCRIARSRQEGFSFQCDVSDWNSVQSCAGQLASKWTSLDALICCAGAQPPIGPAMTLDPVAWSRNLRLNLDGTFFCIRAFHNLFAPSRRAKLICFSGGGATGPRPNFSAYACAKTGVVRLVETLATEWAGKPIDINAVAPGAINTAMTEEVLTLGPAIVGEKEFADAQKQKATGGASLEKVAGLVDYLLSPASDGITGKLISAPWDPWTTLAQHRDALAHSDIYTLRRIVPEDRGQKWS